MTEPAGGQIVNVMKEERLFPPPKDFAAKARISSHGAVRAHVQGGGRRPDRLLGKNGRRTPLVPSPMKGCSSGTMPSAKWFVGGQTNASYNCLDIHLGTPRQHKAGLALGGRARRHPRAHLPDAAHGSVQVRQRAQVAGHRPGRRGVALHADDPRVGRRHAGLRRIGAIHCVVFGGFSAEAIADRNNDAAAKLMITADAGWRRGKQLPLKQTVDRRWRSRPRSRNAWSCGGSGVDVTMRPGRDLWWHELMADASPDCPAEPMDSEAPLFVLYTSGSTGKPKGIKHTTAGYNLFAKKTTEWVFDVRDDDIYWCTADVGLDHRPQLRGLRAACGRGHRRSSTKARPTAPTRTAGGR